MATKKTSKTASKANAAAAPKKKGDMEISPDMPRLVPTGTEKPYAYVFDMNGKAIHSPVGSERFFQAIESLVGTVAAPRVADHADKLEELRPGFGWSRAAKILRGEDLGETEATETPSDTDKGDQTV